MNKKHIVLKIIGTSAMVLTSFIGLLAVLWFFPTIWFNSTTVKWALQKQDVIQFKNFPDDLHAKALNRGFTGKKFEVILPALCFDIKHPEIEISSCIQKLDLGLGIKIIGLKSIQITELNPLQLIAPKLNVSTREIKNNQLSGIDKKQDSAFPIQLSLQKDFNLENILVVIPEWLLNLKGNKTDGTLYVVNNKKDFKIVGSTNGEWTSSVHVVSSVGENSLVEFNVQAKANDAKNTILTELHLKGTATPEKKALQAIGHANAVFKDTAITSIDLTELQLTLDPELSLKSKIQIAFKPLRGAENKNSAFQAPTLNPKLDFNVDVAQSKKGMLAELTLKPGKDLGGLEWQGKAKVALNENFSRIKVLEGNVLVQIEEFANVVKALRKTTYAIPAPFNPLKGPIRFSAGPIKDQEWSKDFSIPLKLRTELRSAGQAVLTDGKGALQIAINPFKADLKFDYTLNEIELELPTFDPIYEPPRFSRDSRISAKRKENTKGNSESSLVYDVRVVSKGKSVSLKSNLVKNKASFDLDLHLTGNGVDSKISASPFFVEYRNRIAEVEKLNLGIASKKSLDIDSRLKIKRADYNLFIDVQDDGAKPRVVMSSDPPLSQDDIISLLLFNQLSSELESDQNQSVSDTQSAVANRALGLFSVWALSSTPVEAFSYNPATRVFSAKVKIKEGLSLTLGSDWNAAQQVGFRKRLGKRWAVSTGATFEENQDNSYRTMLEWFKRF